MVLPLFRSHTYKTQLPILTQDFFEFQQVQDERAASLLSKYIWRILKRAARSKLTKFKNDDGNYEEVYILLPVDFLNRVSRDVVRMTEGELNGIKGCNLSIEYCGGGEIIHIGQIRCDPIEAATTQLVLTLFRNQSVMPKNPILRLIRGIRAENVVCISPGYLLEKRKLSNSENKANPFIANHKTDK